MAEGRTRAADSSFPRAARGRWSAKYATLAGEPHPLTPGPFSPLRTRRGARGEVFARQPKTLLSEDYISSRARRFDARPEMGDEKDDGRQLSGAAHEGQRVEARPPHPRADGDYARVQQDEGRPGKLGATPILVRQAGEARHDPERDAHRKLHDPPDQRYLDVDGPEAPHLRIERHGFIEQH